MRMTTETSSNTGSPRLLRHASNNTLMRKRMERSLRVAEASAVTITMKAVGSLSERNAHKKREKQLNCWRRTADNTSFEWAV